jgi:hypothetical protein
MSSIAAIDRRCFISPPAAPAAQSQPASRSPQEQRAPRTSYLLTWRPPLERAKTRA